MNGSKTIYIDIIADILRDSHALFTIRAKEVADYIDDMITEDTQDLVFIIDLRRANPIDYTFVGPAFSNFLEKIRTKNIDCIFILKATQQWHLFRGLLPKDYIFHSVALLEKEIEKKFFLKISLDNINVLYIGEKAELEVLIIQYVEENGKPSYDEVRKHFEEKGYDIQEIIPAFIRLQENKFLYLEQDLPNKYLISAKSKLNENGYNREH
ncbi:hypothetical protein BH09PAT2_BH09PAT2_08520 [soil metagenome]